MHPEGHQDKDTYRDEALVALKPLLKDSGLDTEEVANALAHFKVKGSPGSTYLKLVELVAKKESDGFWVRAEARFKNQALELVASLKGNEFQQVRGDAEVWACLENHAGRHANWGLKILGMFGLAAWDTPLPDKVVKQRDQSAEDFDEAKKARTAGIDKQMEESPVHWAKLIDEKISYFLIPRGDVMGFFPQSATGR